MTKQLKDELESLRRWKSTHAPRVQALEEMVRTYQLRESASFEAITSLASERAANALLTEEVERLRSALAAPQPEQPEQTVPWPKVEAYAGGADGGGVGAWLEVRMGDGPETARYVVEQAVPAAKQSWEHAGYFYNLVMHALMDVGAAHGGCKYRLQSILEELTPLAAAPQPAEPKASPGDLLRWAVRECGASMNPEGGAFFSEFALGKLAKHLARSQPAEPSPQPVPEFAQQVATPKPSNGAGLRAAAVPQVAADGQREKAVPVVDASDAPEGFVAVAGSRGYPSCSGCHYCQEDDVSPCPKQPNSDLIRCHSANRDDRAEVIFVRAAKEPTC